MAMMATPEAISEHGLAEAASGAAPEALSDPGAADVVAVTTPEVSEPSKRRDVEEPTPVATEPKDRLTSATGGTRRAGTITKWYKKDTLSPNNCDTLCAGVGGTCDWETLNINVDNAAAQAIMTSAILLDGATMPTGIQYQGNTGENTQDKPWCTTSYCKFVNKGTSTTKVNSCSLSANGVSKLCPCAVLPPAPPPGEIATMGAPTIAAETVSG